MAERRMFAKTIIDSDAFLDMPLSTQALYFHLSMRADDDGFINNPKKIQRMCGCSDDDAKLLCAKKFIIPFDSGVVVIKHWRIHNYIRKDTYNETPYKEEKSMLELDENNSYRLQSTSRGRAVDGSWTQDRLGKDRIGKDRIDKGIDGGKPPVVSPFVEFAGEDAELLSALKEFKAHRTKLKKPMTPYAEKLMVSKLKRLSSEKETQIAILNQSIEKGWTGVFEIKEDEPKFPTVSTAFPPAGVKPTFKELYDYINVSHNDVYKVDYKIFTEYYDKHGWPLDWKAKVREWDKRERGLA